jgi:N-terminal domain of anti-restriction factor ArdC
MATKTLPHRQIEALDRAISSASFANYPAIYQGFLAKGIPETDIKPRENVFTFQAWKAKGRSVRKGEHGVKVVTFITIGDKTDPVTGEKISDGYRRPHTTTVFHLSQTEPTSDYRTPRRSAWASGHGRYPSIDPGPRADRDPGYIDPGELAEDRWLETHGDRS